MARVVGLCQKGSRHVLPPGVVVVHILVGFLLKCGRRAGGPALDSICPRPNRVLIGTVAASGWTGIEIGTRETHSKGHCMRFRASLSIAIAKDR